MAALAAIDLTNILTAKFTGSNAKLLRTAYTQRDMRVELIMTSDQNCAKQRKFIRFAHRLTMYQG